MMIKRTIKTGLTILFAFFLTLTHAQEKNYKQIADSLYAKNDYKQVITLFTKELKNHPKNEQLLRGLGFAYIAQGKLELGGNYYNKALEINPNCGNCYTSLAEIAMKEGDKNQAKIYLDTAIIKDAKNVQSYLARATFHEMDGSNFLAMQDYDKAVKLEPENTDLYTYRGEYNLRNGYLFLALSDFNKAIKLDSTNYKAYFNRSHVYYNQQNFTASIKDANKAIELEKNNPKLYIGRGVVYASLNKNKEAIVDYTKAIALNPDDLNTYYSRSLSYYQLENLEASCVDLRKIESELFRGNTNIDTGIMVDIKSKLKDYCEPTNASYYYQRGVAFYNLKEFSKAVAIYTEGLSHFPNNSMMLSFKANAYFQLKDYKNALEYYNLALQNKDNLIQEVRNNPNFINSDEATKQSFVFQSIMGIYFSKSEVYYHLKNYEKALENVDQIIKKESELVGSFLLPMSYYQRGFIHLAEQNFKLALNDINHSLSIDGSNIGAHTKLVVTQLSTLKDVEVISFLVGDDVDKQPFIATWSKTGDTLSTASKMILNDALSACNYALSSDQNHGFAYYLRASVKKLLNQDTYCTDFKKAKELGLVVDAKLLVNCE